MLVADYVVSLVCKGCRAVGGLCVTHNGKKSPLPSFAGLAFFIQSVRCLTKSKKKSPSGTLMTWGTQHIVTKAEQVSHTIGSQNMGWKRPRKIIKVHLLILHRISLRITPWV